MCLLKPTREYCYSLQEDFHTHNGLRARRRDASEERNGVTDEERAINGLVENFIWDVLEEDLIPDLLIEALREPDVANMAVMPRSTEGALSPGRQKSQYEKESNDKDDLLHFRAWVCYS